MSRTTLQWRCSQIIDALDKAERQGSMTAKLRTKIIEGLFYVLTGDPKISPEFESFCKKRRLKGTLAWLLKSIGNDIKLPQALHALATRNMSLKKVLKTWNVAKSDLDLVTNISQMVGLDLNDEQHLMRRYYSSMELNWLGEVEEQLEEVEVIVNRQALQDLLMGVLETYKVPKSKTIPFSEVFGLCLGMASRQKVTKKGSGTRTKWFVSVEKAVPQIRAKAATDSVLPNSKSIEAVIEATSSLFPQLEIIGDYHSHPYRSVQRLKFVKGWEASPSDFIGINELYRGLRTHPKRKHRLRVTFIVAIAKGKAVSAPLTHLKGHRNVIYLNVAGCHIYLSAYRILSNGRMTEKGVTFIPTVGFHQSQAV